MEKDNFQLEQTLSIVTVSAVAQTAPTLEQVPGHDNAAQLGVIKTMDLLDMNFISRSIAPWEQHISGIRLCW